jgi:hypothetical protein
MSQMSNLIRRRSFLARAFATGAAVQLPWLGRARSARAAAPLNFLSFYVPDGVIPSQWYPKGSETSFTLPAMSEPLGAIKDSCIFFEGVGMPGGEPTHPGGTKKVLTGTGPQSMDVFLGQKLKGTAPFDSVQLGVASNFENGSGSVSFIGLGQEVKPDDNPLNAYARLFGGKGTTVTPPTGTPAPGTPDPDALLLKQKKSILDVIKGDITALETKLGAAEKARLESHLSLVRDVESRLSGLVTPPAGGGGTPGTMTGVSCDSKGFNKEGYKNNTAASYPQTYHEQANFAVVGKLQMDLLVMSLGCGLTHSGSLMWSHAVSPTKIPGGSIGNHDASHYGVNAAGNTGQQFISNRRWFMSRFVEMVQAMKALPYGDSNLLDHTVIFLCSDINDGDLHDQRQMPFVLAGGAKAGLRGGRFLSYANKGQGGQGETHTKLLVSIATACGAPVTSFGYTGGGTGPLPGVGGDAPPHGPPGRAETEADGHRHQRVKERDLLRWAEPTSDSGGSPPVPPLRSDRLPARRACSAPARPAALGIGVHEGGDFVLGGAGVELDQAVELLGRAPDAAADR